MGADLSPRYDSLLAAAAGNTFGSHFLLSLGDTTVLRSCPNIPTSFDEHYY